MPAQGGNHACEGHRRLCRRMYPLIKGRAVGNNKHQLPATTFKERIFWRASSSRACSWSEWLAHSEPREGFELCPIERADDGRHQIAGIALRDDLREIVFHGQHQLAQDVEHTSGVVEVVVDVTPRCQVLDLVFAFQGHVACRLFRDASLNIPWRIRQAVAHTPQQRGEVAEELVQVVGAW